MHISDVRILVCIRKTYVMRSPRPLTGAGGGAREASRTTSIYSRQDFAIANQIKLVYLHRALVDKHSVELGESLVGAI